MVVGVADPALSGDAVGRGMVPYVTSWSEENHLPGVVVERFGRGICFADECMADRDGTGVLWIRTAVRPGVGRPVFGKVHTLRQRRAMRRLLCQVCAGPADRTDDGVLWLMTDYRDDWPGWPNRMAQTEPPVCRDCARLSLRLCPALRERAVLVRAGRYPVAGVYGTVYAGGSRLVVADTRAVPLDDPVVRWVLASRLVRQLNDCVLLDPGEL